MDVLNGILPIVLYISLIVLIIVLIVLAIRLIKTVNKVDLLVDDVNEKMDKLDGIFTIVDRTADVVSLMSDKIVTAVISGVTALFNKKKKKKEKENDYE